MNYYPSNFYSQYEQIYYTYNLTDEKGRSISLTIYQKKPIPSGKTAKQLCGLSSLKFNYEGDQKDITSPIVKCSLTLTLCDSPSKSTASKHYGPWDEFYTPDSTKYVVVLSRTLNSITHSWYGYLTPDSYSEDLDASSTITLTFRDNLGHLEDFPFDAEGNSLGLIKIENMIVAALTKIDFLSWCHDNWNTHMLRSIWDNSVTRTYCQAIKMWVPVKAFEGKTWYEALESVLGSIGMCLRYNSRGGDYTVWNMRDMATFGTRASDISLIPLKFTHGTRSYSPAWKMIEETVDFTSDKTVSITPKAVVAAATSTYNVSYFNGSQALQGTGRCSLLDEQTPNRGFIGNTRGYIDPNNFSYSGNEGSDFYKGVFLVANVSQSSPIYQRFSLPIARSDFKVIFRFAPMPATFTRDKNSTLDAGLSQIKYAVIGQDSNGNLYYWDEDNSQWSTTDSDITTSFTSSEYPTDLEVTIPDMSTAPVTLINKVYVEFRDIRYTGNRRRSGRSPLSTAPAGVYARLQTVEITDELAVLPGTSKTTTINDEQFNLTDYRTPALGMNPAVSSGSRYDRGNAKYAQYVIPDECANCFYLEEGGVVPNTVEWHSSEEGEEEILPLQAQIAKQLLMYHHRTFEVLEGECLPVNDSDMMNFYALYTYKSKTFMVQSAVLDLLTGRFENCMLREFSTWNDLYGSPYLTVSPSVIDLRESNSLTLQINCNTGWSIVGKPNELTISPMSGSGPKEVTISVPSGTTSLTGLQNVTVSSTAAGETVQVTLPVIISASLSLLYTGQGTTENLVSGRDHYHQISIYFPAGQTCTIEKPSWIHFYDSSLENDGEVPVPGAYDFYVDALPSGTTTRNDFIDIYCGEDERELDVHQHA